MSEVRAAVLTALVAAMAAAGLAGLLPWAVVVGGALLSGAAVAVASRAEPGRWPLLRSVATGAALLLALLAALAPGDELSSRLLLLLVGVAAAGALRWLTPVEVRTGVLCAGALLVATSAHAVDLLVLGPLLVGWSAVLVACLRLPVLRREQSADVVALPGRRDRLAGTAPVVGLALVLAVVGQLLLPPPGAPPLPLSAQAGGQDGRSPTADATRAQFSSPTMDLTRRVGEPSSDPVLEVSSDSPPLWRSTVYEAYDGSAWWRDERRDRPLAGPPYRLPGTGAPTRTDVAVPTRSDGTVWAPGAVRELGPDRLPPALDTGEGTVRLGFRTRSYQVVSETPVADLATLRAASGPEAVDGRWLQLPALPARVGQLARELTAGAPTRADAVVAVTDWLRGTLAYRLDVPVPAPGEDAVDRFLFTDRAGYCQQFAAASAVLLRSVGIPARVVTGLGYGTDRGSRRTYQVKHLHAWTEVHFPGVGWVPFDATPAADVAAEGASWRDRASTALARLLRDVEDAVGGRLGLVAVLLAGTALVGLTLARRSRRRPVVEPAAEPEPVGGRDLPPALAAFLRLDARLGPGRRRRTESLAELRGRLRPPPEVAEALTVVEQECYAAQPPAQARTAAAVLDGVDPQRLAAGAGLRG